MKISLVLFFVFLSGYIFSQSCSCLDDFHFVRDHIEKNHAAFNKRIKSPDDIAYKVFTTNLETEIQKDKTGKYCIAHLKKYILYMQDHHSNITGSGAPVKEDSAAAVEAFFKSPAYLNTETLAIDENDIFQRLKNSDQPIEGIYRTADSAYEIAIIKDKTERRDYAGIILKSKTKLWSKGQVKMELKKINDSLFEVYTYLRNHALSYDEVSFVNGQLEMPLWIKESAPGRQNRSLISNDLISFKILDSSTTLLSIRSFDGAIYQKLDSAYKVVIPQIRNYPYLIIDVRNNGGGSDRSYQALMPLIYTDPFQGDLVDIYNSPANIKAYRDADDRLRLSPTASKDAFKRNREKMERSPAYSFIPMGDGKPYTVTYPKSSGKLIKIAILYNRRCASSCESFLVEVMNSRRTIMIGENSGGYTGYGNVMSITTPCGNTLSWTTTAYRDRWKYEFVGIPPQYKIPGDETDWVEYTRRLIHQ